MGNPRAPAERRRIQGNPSRRPMSPVHPALQVPLPPAPKELSEGAQAVWGELDAMVPWLAQTNVHILETICADIALMRDMHKKLDLLRADALALGLPAADAYIDGETGRSIGLMRELDRTKSRIMRGLNQIGATPAAAASIMESTSNAAAAVKSSGNGKAKEHLAG